MAETNPTPGTIEKLKGISSAAEVERLTSVINLISETINQGKIPLIQFALSTQPDVQLKRITEGYTYYDKSLKKVRTWDGTSWKDHW
jgi:hypothetical protein